MISNADCTLQSSVSCSPVAITVNNSVTLSLNILATSSTICSGTTATFNAKFVNGELNPLFQWTVNRNPTGTNSMQFAESSGKLSLGVDQHSGIVREHETEWGVNMVRNLYSGLIETSFVYFSHGTKRIREKDSKKTIL